MYTNLSTNMALQSLTATSSQAFYGNDIIFGEELCLNLTLFITTTWVFWTGIRFDYDQF